MSSLAEFRRRFWQPPRAHGEVIEGRTVSFLELFYDLVYVVVISRAAHTLAVHISWRSLGEFAAVFGLTWVAWMNGTLYYELHSRQDVRTRVFVFLQMILLALLAVFTGEAAGGTGASFAIVYCLYLGVLTWLWYSVRRQDPAEFLAVTKRYLVGMVISIVVVALSAGLPAGQRTALWGLVVAGWVVAVAVLTRSTSAQLAFTVSDSMVERYGLFVIIVLGEVVVGVVNGLSAADHSALSIVTGMLGLTIGFAYWWSYFDFAGRRLPVDTQEAKTRWLFAHLPVTMSIVTAGAAMVTLIEDAQMPSTPAPTAWLLTGSVALGLAGLILNLGTLRDFRRVPELFVPVMRGMTVAAAVVLGAGWLAPAPWLLALILVVTLSVLWVLAVRQWLHTDAPELSA